jgi:hypothetical protein
MLYLIGGAGRAGKSIASRTLFLEKQIPFISIDFLVMGFTNGLPHLGIDANKTAEENTHKLWPFIKSMAVCLIENGEDYIIEGIYLMPSQVHELIEEYPEDITACFIGYSGHTPKITSGNKSSLSSNG